jgi:hypothetical protein
MSYVEESLLFDEILENFSELTTDGFGVCGIWKPSIFAWKRDKLIHSFTVFHHLREWLNTKLVTTDLRHTIEGLELVNLASKELKIEVSNGVLIAALESLDWCYRRVVDTPYITVAWKNRCSSKTLKDCSIHSVGNKTANISLACK